MSTQTRHLMHFPAHFGAVIRIREGGPRAWRTLQHHDGQVVVLMAVFLTMFMLGGTLVVDAGLMLNDRRQAQAAVDMAALAAAQDLPWSPGDPSAAAKIATARTTALTYLGVNRYGTVDPDVTVTITTAYQGSPNKILIEAGRVHHWVFGDFWGAIPTTTIRARAVAQTQANAMVHYALMAMNTSQSSALSLNGNASVTITHGGASYVRSSSSSALNLSVTPSSPRRATTSSGAEVRRAMRTGRPRPCTPTTWRIRSRISRRLRPLALVCPDRTRTADTPALRSAPVFTAIRSVLRGSRT
jgi:Flp pilus assembly protein TadG